MRNKAPMALLRLCLALAFTAWVLVAPYQDAAASPPMQCIEICPDYAPDCGDVLCDCEDMYVWNDPDKHAGPGVTTCTNCWDTGCGCFPVPN